MGAGDVASFRIAKVIKRLVKNKQENPAAPAVSPIPASSRPQTASGQS
jgi:hypothetical protein